MADHPDQYDFLLSFRIYPLQKDSLAVQGVQTNAVSLADERRSLPQLSRPRRLKNPQSKRLSAGLAGRLNLLAPMSFAP
jgi:hypothetical protein